MRTPRLTLALSLLSTISLSAGINLKQEGKNLQVIVDGKLFTEYHGETRVPCLYPLMSPSGTHLTRQYPFVKDVAGEKSDHPHHTGFWFTHGNVNGHDFWHTDDCKIVTRRITGTKVSQKGDQAAVTFSAELAWEAKGKPIVLEQRRYDITLAGKTRIVDVTSAMKPAGDNVTFGDTKEGSFAIRTAPSLRLVGEVAKGKITNSEGVKDNDAWGKRARWVAYHGPDSAGTPQVIAIFDHNRNLRHPTWWHARNYGLLTANPFGIRAFRDKSVKESGNFELKKGESLTQRYRLLLHEGSLDSAKVEEAWKSFVAGK
jgi:hypothetical protein